MKAKRLAFKYLGSDDKVLFEIEHWRNRKKGEMRKIIKAVVREEIFSAFQ